ncbi:MAG: trigger factor [Clostridia bacterium]|nr:trigger factor [Clostridia bacterium]
MKTTLIGREKNDVKFTMDFTAEEFEAGIVKAYQANKNKIEVDGFRKGKAPRKVIEAKYGKEIFFEDALDNLLQNGYPEAVNELGLKVVDYPKMEFGTIEAGKPVVITATVTVEPEVTVKDYKGVEIEKVVQEVKEEDVDKEVEAMRKSLASMVLVDRPAKLGDTLLLDYSGSVDGVKFEGGTAERQNLTLGSGMFIPGFEDQLVGATPGEKRDVKVTFPTEYHAEDLAGKEAVFECLVHEITEEQLPELDDEFAQDKNFDTLADLRADVKGKLEKYAAESAKNRMMDAAMLKVAEATEVEVPEAMVNSEVENGIQQLSQNLAYQGLQLEQYLQFTGKTMDDLKAEYKPEAEKQVKTRLVLEAIVKQEGLVADEADVEKELEDMANQYGMKLEEVKKALGDGVEYLRKDLAMKKAIELIYENAKVVEK